MSSAPLIVVMEGRGMPVADAGDSVGKEGKEAGMLECRLRLVKTASSRRISASGKPNNQERWKRVWLFLFRFQGIIQHSVPLEREKRLEPFA